MIEAEHRSFIHCCRWYHWCYEHLSRLNHWISAAKHTAMTIVKWKCTNRHWISAQGNLTIVSTCFQANGVQCDLEFRQCANKH